ncbi:MAG TPA: hypothetical protein VM689_13470 [Aliidongia sp.]|nr:hypothetical protein [Aliidongia sp.]
MIVEIPGSADFKKTSLNLLNLAWYIAIASLEAYSFSDIIHPVDTPVQHIPGIDGTLRTIGGPDTTWSPQEREVAEQQYWRRSQPALANALSLIQQAIEMALKGQIAEISPFLLIARDARDYPTKSAQQDVSFSAFRSLDAADLLKVHNTVCSERLDDKFEGFWNSIRRQRNVFIHSVVPISEVLKPTDLIEKILLTVRTMHREQEWFGHRVEYCQKDEIEAAFSTDSGSRFGRVLQEFEIVFHYLSSKALREYFGLDRRRRTYMCTHCMKECDSDIWNDLHQHFAQFDGKDPSSSAVKCALCARSIKIFRGQCMDKECKSSVLCDDVEYGRICLICGIGQSD